MDERSKHLRRLIVRALEGGGRGHVGASMSLVEIMRVLYDSIGEQRVLCQAPVALRQDDPVIGPRDAVVQHPHDLDQRHRGANMAAVSALKRPHNQPAQVLAALVHHLKNTKPQSPV